MSEEHEEGIQTRPSEVERIRVEGGHLAVQAGGHLAKFALDDLRGRWASWQQLEGALKRLDLPLSPAEAAILEGIADTPQARNGLAELRSALARTHRAT